MRGKIEFRFHKAESAFFVFTALVFAAAGAALYAFLILNGHVDSPGTPGQSEVKETSRLLFSTVVLLVAALLFGVFLIFPIIRRQGREKDELRAMTATLTERSDTMQQAALTDGLTGMQNRRYFDDALREYLEEFSRIKKPVGLMIIDLDHFKKVNDTHGHDIGDAVLRAVAGCLQEFTRFHDIVARLGGEEFAIVAPNLDEELLIKLAERIRKAIGSLTVPAGNVRLRVTASLGLAVWNGKETAEGFYRRADMRLYEAKRMGRNRVSA